MTQEADRKYIKLRDKMLKEQIAGRGITSEAILAAFSRVPRHRFVPSGYVSLAYEDRPLPVGPNQTISQPYVVALMLEKLEIKPSDRVLEIGTGSGYETALLAELAGEVYSVEIDSQLVEKTRKLIADLDYSYVYIKEGNGFSGWPRMILPLGEEFQVLVTLDKNTDGLESKEWGGVRFVEMIKEK